MNPTQSLQQIGWRRNATIQNKLSINRGCRIRPNKSHMYIQFVDRGVLMIQQMPIENVNAFLSSQDKDIFLKDQLMTNPSFRKRIQKRSTIAKSLFPN